MLHSALISKRLFGWLVLACVPWFLCSLSNASTEASAAGLATPVVGGRLARPGEWPDVVAVLGEDGSLCSGTLLGADLVLTAAHCIEGHPQEVIVGAVDLAEPGGQRRDVKWSRAYPAWQTSFDVGIVMLENPVSVHPRAVAEGCTTTDDLARGDIVQLVGFGQTTATASDDNTRLHVAALRITDPTCTHDAACEPSIAPGGELVAGGDGTDACFGDSGGPLYIPTATGPALIGVVSRGLILSETPCGDGGVFVRADRVVRWIESESGRTLRRAACDPPGDDPSTPPGSDDTGNAGTPDGVPAGADDAGCNAIGAGALAPGFTVPAALLCLGAMRRGRRARRVTTRSPWPRSR